MGEKNEYLNTLGRDRTDILDGINEIVKGQNPQNRCFLELENNHYYDSLSENSEAKKDLKNKWDKLSIEKQKYIKQFKKRWTAADPPDRSDLLQEKIIMLWNFEINKAKEVRRNYFYFKTYWEENTPEYEY